MAIMLAHGFNPEMMVEIVRDGLATASAERVVEAHVRCRRVRVTEDRDTPWRVDFGVPLARKRRIEAAVEQCAAFAVGGRVAALRFSR